MKLEWKLDSHTMNWIGYGDGLEYHGVVERKKATFQEIHDAKIDNIALANGYVKASDLDALATSAGYVKVGKGQVVLDAQKLMTVLNGFCTSCQFESVEEPDCGACFAKPIRDAIKEARDE